jgi:diguanylate cyclase (GGDEF)-like protein
MTGFSSANGLIGRYGNDEFIVVFINANKEQVMYRVDGLLDIIRNKIFLYENSEIIITFSGGISDSSEIDKSISSVEKIFAVADNRLRNAKKTGKNRVLIS